MSSITRLSLSAIALSAIVGMSWSLPAYATNDRAVENYTCKEVMRESGVDRNAAIAFLHGFILGKSGSTKFNLEALAKQTDNFIDNCLDNPTSKAIDVLTKVKG